MKFTNLLLIGGSLLGAGIVVGIVAVYNYDPLHWKMTRACEAVVQARLLAPSTYRRVSLSEEVKSIPLDEYRQMKWAEIHQMNLSADGWEVQDKLLDLDIAAMKQRNFLPQRFREFITYDAANGFGTPIRGVSECDYVSLSGDTAGANDLTVMVDGKNKLDYLDEEMKQANQSR